MSFSRQRTVDADSWNSELRSHLHGLTELSMDTTRRLDDIYYSILERVSQLHSTIDNLQELSSLTRNLNRRFDQEAEELQRDLEDHMSTFGGFQVQKSRIGSLETRLQRSRDKSGRLNDRLEAARKKIAALGTREGEWQATVARTLRDLFVVPWTLLTLSQVESRTSGVFWAGWVFLSSSL